MATRHALVAIVTLALSAKRGVLATATPLATATDHVLSGADRDTAGAARAPQSQVSPPPFDDWHYPPEELDEEALVRELRLLSADEQEQVRGVSHMTHQPHRQHVVSHLLCCVQNVDAASFTNNRRHATSV
jgi:hypothetical protein